MEYATISGKDFVDGNWAHKKKGWLVFDAKGQFVKFMIIEKDKLAIFAHALSASRHFAQQEATLLSEDIKALMYEPGALQKALVKVGWLFDDNGEVVTKA